MEQYTVRSGQNIYDVALTLYGTVEGIFDLLISNDDINMETTLKRGMVLNYHKELQINSDIVTWLEDNNVLVRNGEHIYDYQDIEATIKQHIYSYHAAMYDELQWLSADERNIFWEELITPKMIIKQQGNLSRVNIWLKKDCHALIDWGDYSAVEIIEGDEEVELEHCYRSTGSHKIIFYGNMNCYMLDLSESNGVHYPLGNIYTGHFKEAININDLNKLVITQ